MRPSCRLFRDQILTHPTGWYLQSQPTVSVQTLGDMVAASSAVSQSRSDSLKLVATLNKLSVTRLSREHGFVLFIHKKVIANWTRMVFFTNNIKVLLHSNNNYKVLRLTGVDCQGIITHYITKLLNSTSRLIWAR